MGVPADEVANLYQEIAAEEQTAPVAVPSVKDDANSHQTWWLYGLAALLVLVFVGFWYVGEDSLPVDADVSPDTGVAEMQPAAEAEAASAPTEDPALQADAEVETTEVVANQAAQVAADEPAAVEPAQDRLSMSFSDACWVRVVDASGDEVYSGQRAAGASLAVQGEGPFRITLGNAAAVSEININGTVMPVPVSTPGRVVTVRTP